jgi:lia operon protein LiaG
MTRMMRGWVAIAVVLVAAPATAQEVHRVTGPDVAIYNLVGRARVVSGSSNDVVVRVTRGGADASDLTIETGLIEGRSTLRIRYPSDEIVYPAIGRGSRSTFSVERDGTFGDGGGRGDRGDRVEIRGTGSGLEAWADLVIEVPVGSETSVYVAAGEMDATGVDATLRLDMGSGNVTATNVSGALSIDTGSGGVNVRGVRGTLDLDTGSGSVSVADVVGDAVSLDTGSGRVNATGIETQTLNVDTGSGSVDLVRISAPTVMVDTGSGSVELELLQDVDLLEIDTGSGSVTVTAPADLGGTVEIDTGSGGIDLDFPLEVRSVRRDRVQGRLGDGDGTIVIDTGSGGIRIVRGGSL